jgi:hypothetical protein
LTAWDVIGSGRTFRVKGERAVYREAYYTGEERTDNVRLSRPVQIKGQIVAQIVRYVDPDTPVEFA